MNIRELIGFLEAHPDQDEEVQIYNPINEEWHQIAEVYHDGDGEDMFMVIETGDYVL